MMITMDEEDEMLNVSLSGKRTQNISLRKNKIMGPNSANSSHLRKTTHPRPKKKSLLAIFFLDGDKKPLPLDKKCTT